MRAAKREILPGVEHRQHKGLNNRAENSHQPLLLREKKMRRFTSAKHAQPFLSPFGLIHYHITYSIRFSFSSTPCPDSFSRQHSAPVNRTMSGALPSQRLSSHPIPERSRLLSSHQTHHPLPDPRGTTLSACKIDCPG